MPWIYLTIAGLAEIGWVIAMKYSIGFTRPIPVLFMIAGLIVSLGLLTIAMKHLPLGTAYAIWTGIGAVGSVLAGIILFNESIDLIRLSCIAMIVAGIAGLKIISNV